MCPNIKNSPSSQAGPPKKMNGVPEPGSWDEATTGIPNPGKKKNPHEDEEQLLEKRHSGHISAARVAIPPRPTPGFKEFRGDNVVCGATTQSLILRQKPKKRSCPLPLTLSYCNNACCATMQNESGWGSHIWGGLGGAIAAQVAIREIGGGIAL